MPVISIALAVSDCRYAPTLLNPATGWLAWWKNADGELHDYAASTVSRYIPPPVYLDCLIVIDTYPPARSQFHVAELGLIHDHKCCRRGQPA